MTSRRTGVLTFEWMLLFVCMVLGIIGGAAVIRDALIIESAETADAILSHDKSYHIAPPVRANLSMKSTETYVNPNAPELGKTNSPAVSGETYEMVTGSYAGGTDYVDRPGNVEVRTPGKYVFQSETQIGK